MKKDPPPQKKKKKIPVCFTKRVYKSLKTIPLKTDHLNKVIPSLFHLKSS